MSATEPGVAADQRVVDRAWVRIGVGLVIAAQAMVFSLALNLTERDGLDLPRGVVHGILLASAVAVIVFLGRDLMRESWRALVQRRVTVDLLFAVTLLGALGGSLIGTFRGVGEVYYEVIAILVVVHTLGKMLGARSRLAALQAADDLRRQVSRCRVVREGVEQAVRPEQVVAGERVRVAPGERVAVDGAIVEGHADIDESAMTGEWKPVPRGPGDRVLAGTHALDGDLLVRADGGPRRIDAILDQVERSRLAPSRLQEQVDRLTARFLPVVVGMSLLTGGAWAMCSTWDRALFNAMAVLLVACPCAMGLATPAAVWGALAAMGRMGLVARSGDFVDALSRVDMVFLDKTGTLSQPGLLVSDERWLNATLAAAGRAATAALERDLAHPIAQAIAATLPESVPAADRRVLGGRGVEGTHAGAFWRVGVGELGSEVPDEFVSGKWIHVFRDGEWSGAFRLEERWREGVDRLGGEFAGLGVRAQVLSGDPAARAMRAANLDVVGGLTAAEKAERVRRAREDGACVLFVGDGINDAEALAEADVSIAVSSGAELARSAAAGILTGGDIRVLPRAISLARRARQAISQNLAFAAVYNLVGMALAASGHLHPVAAALLMVGASLFVTIRSVRMVSAASS